MVVVRSGSAGSLCFPLQSLTGESLAGNQLSESAVNGSQHTRQQHTRFAWILGLRLTLSSIAVEMGVRDENGQNGDHILDYQDDTTDVDGQVDDVVQQEQEVPSQVPIDPPRRSNRERRQSTHYSSNEYVLLTDGGKPESNEEVVESEQKRQCLEAMQDEMNSLYANNTFELVRAPKNKEALKNRFDAMRASSPWIKTNQEVASKTRKICQRRLELWNVGYVLDCFDNPVVTIAIHSHFEGAHKMWITYSPRYEVPSWPLFDQSFEETIASTPRALATLQYSCHPCPRYTLEAAFARKRAILCEEESVLGM
nr:Retrovirus-related Pol polyprotein from transposon TNT 1-94 [Ipomoea batatas]